jgi:hypothetical protein
LGKSGGDFGEKNLYFPDGFGKISIFKRGGWVGGKIFYFKKMGWRSFLFEKWSGLLGAL